MTTPSTHPESRAKVILGTAIALIAAYFLTVVVTQDLSKYSTMAEFVAKGTVGALGLMFCLLLWSSFGRIFRKIVGVCSLLLASLLFLGAFFGVFAWLLENMPFSGIFGGRMPAAIAASFVANAYIAWAFCFSPAVRAYERRSHQAAPSTPGLPSMSDP